ncbi:uncharacterized protein LOC109814256 [Cajanus cajan]|uniref:uncharacterized protein LOC109814256 n=1 Tax=Cajanus cajan TaxID=3821 RepID=UPI00098D9BE2|nr:uncharacterized protein LOC109814256 [Cajanus cajan]
MQWFNKFSSTLKAHGFTQSRNDYSLFTCGNDTNLVTLIVYVDDIIVAGPNATRIHQVQTTLQKIFKLKVLGDLKYFLGLEIARSSKGINLCQRKYVLELLSDTGFLASKPTSLPMDPNNNLNAEIGDLLPDPSLYRRLIGRLLYLTISRPDITYVVHKLSQFMQSPTNIPLKVVHHLLQYLKGTPGQGILFPANSTLQLTVYCDADWAGCLSTRRSTTENLGRQRSTTIAVDLELELWKSGKELEIQKVATIVVDLQL